ncbi:hypothetical protein PCASD_14635 [Puccinia coronata f. sp. avenae]|uniref:Uncharacterized protein n=1 Tax=Puccinia coronata f. sp. avenae TaxID=200324 RepID=A0A2N5U441_9BASI|nr:hypothetical protein PCASD_14635 [Puccinia coronata f. sp. avenae]
MAAPSFEFGMAVESAAGKGKALAETGPQLERAKTMGSILSDSDGKGSFLGPRTDSEIRTLRSERNPDRPTMTGKKEHPHPEKPAGSDKKWYDSIPENLQAERAQFAAKEILKMSKKQNNLIRELSRAEILQKRPAWLEVWAQNEAAYRGVVVRLDIESNNPGELKKLKNAANLISKHHPYVLSTDRLTDAQKILQQANSDYRQWREKSNFSDGRWGALSRLKKNLMRPWRNLVDQQLEKSVDYVLEHQPNWLRSRMKEEVREVDSNVEMKLNKAAAFIRKHDASEQILSDSKILDQLGKSMGVGKNKSENTPQQLATAD